MVPLTLAAILAAMLVARGVLRRRRDRAVSAALALRLSTRLLRADAVHLGAKLAATGADERASAAHARAERLLASASSADDLRRAAELLAVAQDARARTTSGTDDVVSPEPGPPPCFFDPAHGPAATDVACPGAEPTVTLPACAADARLLEVGRAPDSRMVRAEDRSVPWFHAGPAYDAYADAWFGTTDVADAITSVRSSSSAAWHNAGSWDRIGWAPCSIGGLGEGPNGVHRIGQMLSGQFLDASGGQTTQRRR